jgi:hypothetical protein
MTLDARSRTEGRHRLNQMNIYSPLFRDVMTTTARSCYGRNAALFVVRVLSRAALASATSFLR